MGTKADWGRMSCHNIGLILQASLMKLDRVACAAGHAHPLRFFVSQCFIGHRLLAKFDARCEVMILSSVVSHLFSHFHLGFRSCHQVDRQWISLLLLLMSVSTLHIQYRLLLLAVPQ